MEFSVYFDKKLNEEDLDFFKSMLEEIILKKDIISYFITQDACYSLAEIIMIIDQLRLKTNADTKYIYLIIDSDEFKGLGLEKDERIKDSALMSLKFLGKDDFYDKLFASSSKIDGRHLNF